MAALRQLQRSAVPVKARQAALIRDYERESRSAEGIVRSSALEIELTKRVRGPHLIHRCYSLPERAESITAPSGHGAYMSEVMNYLDCGCAIMRDGSRSWCPTCSNPALVNHLHEAAPDLLAALEALYEHTADYIRLNHLGDIHHNQSMKMARDAIVKAKGG